MVDESVHSRDKRHKFVALANKRVSKALKDIQLISNLANKKNYDYTDDEAKKIVKALQSEVDHVKHIFQSGTKSPKNEFKL